MSNPDHASLAANRPGPLLRLLAVREIPILLVLFVIVAVAASIDPHVVSLDNAKTILMFIPLLLIVAMGQMIVILTAGIDVSVGSIMGLAGMIVGIYFRDHPDTQSVLLGCIMATVIGAGLGLFNGGLIAFCAVPPIVATLGTLGVFRGLVYVVSDNKQINAYQLPEALDRISRDGPFGTSSFVPWLIVIALVVVIATSLFLRYIRLGRDIYALGGNPDAARLRGIPVKRITLFVYVMAGAFSGLAGILYASKFGTINPAVIGTGFELQVISAVVVGGVSIFGGSGTVLGVVLGCVLLGTISTMLTVLGAPEAWQATSYGLIILTAVVFDDLLAAYLNRRSARAGG
jgi:rhamnose transport system permease protein